MRRQRLTLYRRESTADDFRASDEEATAVAEVWAEIKPAGGGETEQAGQQQSDETYDIRFRWGVSIADIDATWWAEREDQLTGKTVRYDFRSVANEGEANRWFVAKGVRRG